MELGLFTHRRQAAAALAAKAQAKNAKPFSRHGVSSSQFGSPELAIRRLDRCQGKRAGGIQQSADKKRFMSGHQPRMGLRHWRH